MKRALTLCAAVIFSLFGCNDDDNPKITTVADAVNFRDGAYVKITGTLDEMIVAEWYTFSDGTSSITVEIENEVWGRSGINPATLTLPAPFEITGEVEKDRGQPTVIEVERLRQL